MELIEYRGFNNKFIGLAKENEQYFIIYGKIGPVKLSMTDDEIFAYGLKGIKIGSFTTDQKYELSIPFVPGLNNNSIIFIQHADKRIYKTCCEILENIL